MWSGAVVMEERFLLPDTIEDIAEVIGRDRAIYFVGQLQQSGRRSWRRCVYIPKKIEPDHQLVKILGWRDAERLVRVFGGMILQPSNCLVLFRDFRRSEILRRGEAGEEPRQIAKSLGISVRHVKGVLQGKPPEDFADGP